MEKFIKISSITLITIVSLIIISAIIAPPVAKNYINKHGKELIGRKVQVNGLYSNLFTGYNRITDLTLYEIDDTTPFVAFDTLVVNLSLYRLLAHELKINEITLVNPRVNVWQEGETFNFNDLLALAASDSTDTTTPQDLVDETPMAIAINNINLREGHLVYKDRVRQSTWDMKNMNLHIPGIYFSGKNTNVGINLNFSNGGNLKTQTEYNLTNGDYRVHLNLQDLSMDNLQAYLADYLNISQLDGLLSADMNISGNINHVLDLTVQGKTSLKKLSLSDIRQNNVLTLDALEIDIQEINPSSGIFHLNALTLQGATTSFHLYNDHNNFTELVKAIPADTTAVPDTTAEIPVQFKLDKLQISACALTFNDHTLEKIFTFPMTSISMLADTLTLSGTNQIRMDMQLGQSGSARVNWKGKLDDISNLNLSVNIKNVALHDFDTYCLHYFGYPIRKGNISFSSINVITNNQLEGRNSLDAYRFELENKRKDLKPEYNIPMKTALYLIKDKDDKIKIDLPVQGNISSPEFSYRKLIFKTLTNLLVKIAVSPVTFMAHSLGFSPDRLEAIPLDPCQWDFTSEQFSTLNDLVTIVKNKPDMTLVLEQNINLPQAREELALFNAKKKYYITLHPGKNDSTLVAIDYAKINEIATKDTGFNTYLSSIVPATNQNESTATKALMLIPGQTLQQQIDRLIALRNRKVTSYLISQGIPPANLRVETMTTGKLDTYNGKNQYKINLTLAGDEQAPEIKE